MMTPVELEQLLDAAAGKAESLRNAGVLYVEVGEVKLHLAPPELSLPDLGPGDQSEPIDPLSDPATFGREDGSVPGFERVRQRRQREEP